MSKYNHEFCGALMDFTNDLNKFNSIIWWQKKVVTLECETANQFISILPMNSWTLCSGSIKKDKWSKFIQIQRGISIFYSTSTTRFLHPSIWVWIFRYLVQRATVGAILGLFQDIDFCVWWHMVTRYPGLNALCCVLKSLPFHSSSFSICLYLLIFSGTTLHWKI